MPSKAVWVPNDPVPLVRVDQKVEVVGNPRLRSCWKGALCGAYVPPLMWHLAGRPQGFETTGIRDDNRSALLTEERFKIRDREYFVAVKGCGADFDAYQHSPLTSRVLSAICHDEALVSELESKNNGSSRFITAERWFGNTPYGGQAPDNAMLGLLASLRANRDEIQGFHICPIVALVQLPKEYQEIASHFYWYRKYSGTYWQEFRLMPSNVRLYFQSPLTFGADTGRAFSLFDLKSFDSCEKFLWNLARSTMAALTLYARTIRHDPHSDSYLGLGYHDVWLDKDAVIASDGTLHFADLEGIEDIRAKNAEEAREQMLMQFYRNVYEANFALEAMAAQTEKELAMAMSRKERRAWLIDVLTKACRADPYVKLESKGSGILAVIEPAVDKDMLAVEIDLFSGDD
jgi:hypothetical protein